MQQDSASFWADIKTLEERLAQDPDSYLFAKLAEIYLKVDLLDDALHTARQGVAKYPAYIAGQRSLAMACFAKGLYDECTQALKVVVEASPEDTSAQKMLARLLAGSGSSSAAKRAYRTALEFTPDDAECQAELASLEQSGDMISSFAPAAAFTGVAVGAATLGALSAAAHADDQDEIIQLTEADIIELREDDIVEDEQPVAYASALPQHDPLSTATLAELYVTQGFTEKALAIYHAILVDDPDNSRIKSRIAELEASSAAPVAEPETASLAVPAQGFADNALATLQGWLENIRRIKACR